MSARPIAVVAMLAAVAAAQTTRVVPAGMDHVEGPSVYTPPFSTATGAIHVLFDAGQITAGVAAITHLRLRPSQATQSSAGFTKNYRVTAWTVAMNAAGAAALGSPFDPNQMILGATGTVLFDGPVTLPPTGPLPVAPAPFSIAIALTTPCVFDSSQGNLLLRLEASDASAVPGTYRIDAVQFRNDQVTGIAAAIDAAGCTAAGAGLALATAATSCTIGSAIDQTVTSSLPGAFPVVLVFLGFDRQDLDLTLLGMPGCAARLGGSPVFQLLLETPGGYPHALWNVPAVPAFVGIAAFSQVLGLPPGGTLAGAVVSNAQALRLGSNNLPPIQIVSSFLSNGQWFQGQAGQFSPVLQLEGVF